MIDFDDFKTLSDYDTNHVFTRKYKNFQVLKIKKLFIEKIFSKKAKSKKRMDPNT